MDRAEQDKVNLFLSLIFYKERVLLLLLFTKFWIKLNKF